MRTIHHLHCEDWADTEVPRDTKVLLDLYDEAEYNLAMMPESFLMVHCSGGAGRTGTFIGLFKLIRDYKNRKVSQGKMSGILSLTSSALVNLFSISAQSDQEYQSDKSLSLQKHHLVYSTFNCNPRLTIWIRLRPWWQ